MNRSFKIILYILFVSLQVFAQQNKKTFFQSPGLHLYNQQQYAAAVDSILDWANKYFSERGIGYYFIGESYYNLGVEARDKSNAADYFKNSIAFLERALEQPDFITNHTDLIPSAYYKAGWSHYRLGEISDNPASLLLSASQFFNRLKQFENDSLLIWSRFMEGESKLRLGNWYLLQLPLAEQQSVQLANAQNALNHLRAAFELFRTIPDIGSLPHSLRFAFNMKLNDSRFQLGKLFSLCRPDIFKEVVYDEKRTSAVNTAKAIFEEISYSSLLEGHDGRLYSTWNSPLKLNNAFYYLHRFLIDPVPEKLLSLNQAIDSLDASAEKYFFQGVVDLERMQFADLPKAEDGFFARAASQISEAWYWQGWTAFIVNDSESEKYFSNFIDRTNNIKNDIRLEFLREDAQYRIYMLQFDKYAGNLSKLRELSRDIANFNPVFETLQIRVELLKQLIGVPIHEEIWRDVITNMPDHQKLDQAFILIQNMLQRAARVVGREREIYLSYLRRLFEITQGRRSLETTFYRGMALFLEAVIQETPAEKRRFYLSAADTLSRVSGEYLYEGRYIQARSYLAAAEQLASGNPDQYYNRAKEIFSQLVIEQKSLRALFYLSEIHRIQGEHHVARKYYDIITNITYQHEDGRFWYDNTAAAIQTLRMNDQSTDRLNLNNSSVSFPDILLEINGNVISLEKFADSEYIRGQYRQEAVNLYVQLGLVKPQLYPSINRINNSRFLTNAYDSDFEYDEMLGTIVSGLRLKVLAGDYVPEVWLEKEKLEINSQGYYEKIPVTIGQVLSVHVSGANHYPVVKKVVFKSPGVENETIALPKKFNLESTDIQTGRPLPLIKINRLDKAAFFQSGNLPVGSGTQLYRDFQNSIHFRDFVFSKDHNAYLAVRSDSQNIYNIYRYRNNNMISKEDDSAISIPDTLNIKSLEGITVDSHGNIYLVDWANHKIIVLDRNGKFINSFGEFGDNRAIEPGEKVRLLYPTKCLVIEDKRGVQMNNETFYRPAYLVVADYNGIHFMDIHGLYWFTYKPQAIQPGTPISISAEGYGENMILHVFDRENQESISIEAVTR